jgi:hypothetical protein
MIIFKESLIGLEDWKNQVAGQVFRAINFRSKGGMGIFEAGQFCVFPEHKNFDRGNLTICSSAGPVTTKMCIVIDDAVRNIANIVPSLGKTGFDIFLRTGDKITIVY